jgi:membrane protein DedA with SNARE-associated domain
VIDIYGLGSQAEAYRAAYNDWGLWIILIKGLTPIPYKLVTIASGAAAFNFWIFLGASIVTRGARFFLVAALLHRFGEPIREFIERRLTLVTTTFVVFLIGGFVVVRYLV